MDDVERVCEHVLLIDTEALGYRETVAAYLIVGSRSVMLVDSGYPRAVNILVRVLSDFSHGDKDLIFFPTHVHLDHCGSIGALTRAFPGARVIAHRRAARHLVDPSRLVKSVRSIYGEGFLDEVGLPDPVPEDVISSFEDEIEVDLGGVRVRGIYTPGHAPHHASLFVEPDKAIISGDAVSTRIPAAAGIPIPATPPPSFDLEEAIRSLRRLESLRAERILLAHFGPLDLWEGYFMEEEVELRRWIDEAWRTYREEGDEGEALARVARRIAGRIGIEELPVTLIGTVYVSFAGALDYLRRTCEGCDRLGGPRQPRRGT